MRYGRYDYGMMGGGEFKLVLCIIGFLIFLAVAATIIFLIVRHMKNKMHPGLFTGGNAFGGHGLYAGKALEILNERYAKGEIEDEEYIRKKAELSKN